MAKTQLFPYFIEINKFDSIFVYDYNRAKTVSEKIQQNFEQREKLHNKPHLEEIPIKSSTLQNHLNDINAIR